MLLIVVCAVLLVNVAHDMAVPVQQSLFTDMFGPEYRYSGAGVGYRLASAVGGGFTPLIAGSLVIWAGGGWSLVAAYVALGRLVILPDRAAAARRGHGQGVGRRTRGGRGGLTDRRKPLSEKPGAPRLTAQRIVRTV
jgi:MHS family shikimate/dehydroshikimate transporter-like MFS transporter